MTSSSLACGQAGFTPLVRAARRRHAASRVVPRRLSSTAAVHAAASGGESASETTAQVEERDEGDDAYVETDEETRERQAVGALVGWCVQRGAQGSGLSVLLPDGSGRGRGLEASRALQVRARRPCRSRPLSLSHSCPSTDLSYP